MDRIFSDAAARIADLLRSSPRVVIPLHLNPDGDTTGSALAMSIVLRRWHVVHGCYSADPVPSYLQFLPHAEAIEPLDFAALQFDPRDLVLCLDNDRLARFTHAAVERLPRVRIVNIDHHETNTHFGIENLTLRRSSTAEVLVGMLDALREEITAEVATCLLTGIVTDTESFSHAATPATLETAARLQRAGADYERINAEVFRNFSLPVLRLWGMIFLRTDVVRHLSVAWSTITYADIQGAGIAAADIHTVVTACINRFLQSLAAVDLVFLCAEEQPGTTRVSLRSPRQRFDVGAIAGRFGGGGHAAAAGFELPGAPGTLARRVLDELAAAKGRGTIADR